MLQCISGGVFFWKYVHFIAEQLLNFWYREQTMAQNNEGLLHPIVMRYCLNYQYAKHHKFRQKPQSDNGLTLRSYLIVLVGAIVFVFGSPNKCCANICLSGSYKDFRWFPDFYKKRTQNF